MFSCFLFTLDALRPGLPGDQSAASVLFDKLPLDSLREQKGVSVACTYSFAAPGRLGTVINQSTKDSAVLPSVILSSEILPSVSLPRVSLLVKVAAIFTKAGEPSVIFHKTKGIPWAGTSPHEPQTSELDSATTSTKTNSAPASSNHQSRSEESSGGQKTPRALSQAKLGPRRRSSVLRIPPTLLHGVHLD